MNASSLDLGLVELLIQRARQMISIKCYAEAGNTLDYLYSQLQYGVMSHARPSA